MISEIMPGWEVATRHDPRNKYREKNLLFGKIDGEDGREGV